MPTATRALRSKVDLVSDDEKVTPRRSSTRTAKFKQPAVERNSPYNSASSSRSEHKIRAKCKHK